MSLAPLRRASEILPFVRATSFPTRCNGTIVTPIGSTTPCNRPTW